MNSTEQKYSTNPRGWYWAHILSDILIQMQKLPIKENKDIIHREFKEYLGVKTTVGMNDKQMRLFVNKVIMVCAREKGIFVRTNDKQPELLIDRPLSELWEVL